MGHRSGRSKPRGQAPLGPPAGEAPPLRTPQIVPAVCVLLLLATVLIFGQTVRFDFVFDDDSYVVENSHVHAGLTARGIAWAFTQGYAANWHPLTWISHMLDCQFYGLWAGGHHLTNILLHAATAIGLFLVLRQMFGAVWPGALAAALFAVHPLRVESVAWVSERKDVLSGLLFMLTLAAYIRYVRRPPSLGRYLAVVGWFALGLMAKPMLVTLPLVLLLLDYWPLGRLSAARDLAPDGDGGFAAETGFRGHGFLIVEKIPLFLLAAASCVATILAQGKAIQSIERIPILPRLANALVSYADYLRLFVCPMRLAAFYPHPENGLSTAEIAGALVVLAGISAAAVLWRRKHPYLLVGWLWYLGMLVPAIGLVQVGAQAMADRYTYLPQIGLVLAVVGVLDRICRPLAYRRWIVGVASGLLLAVLMAAAWQQTTYWHDGEALWGHTLACTSKNEKAEYNLGVVLQREGRDDEAIAQYRKALELNRWDVGAHNNYGAALEKRGEIDEAIAEFQTALGIDPESAEAWKNRGDALLAKGHLDEAAASLREALRFRPDYAEAHNSLGNVLFRGRRVDEAISEYQRALENQPEYAMAHNGLGSALAERGRMGEAIAEWRTALDLRPDNVLARRNLVMALCEQGKLQEAVVLAAGEKNPAAARGLRDFLLRYEAGTARRLQRPAPRGQAPP